MGGPNGRILSDHPLHLLEARHHPFQLSLLRPSRNRGGSCSHVAISSCHGPRRSNLRALWRFCHSPFLPSSCRRMHANAGRVSRGSGASRGEEELRGAAGAYSA